MTQAASIVFPAPGRIPYPGGCVLEPGPYALEYLLRWAANVQVGDTVYQDTPVFPLLREVLAHPEAFGVTAGAAQAAQTRFLEQAGQALEAEGGDPAWLAREFER